jgi:hypothetical protein
MPAREREHHRLFSSMIASASWQQYSMKAARLASVRQMIRARALAA